MQTITLIAVISVVISIICTLIIAIDVTQRRQHMWIMNLVWPITALYSGVLGLWVYFAIGRAAKKPDNSAQHQMDMPQKPFWQSVLLGALHCGSGCTLGDLIVSSTLLLIPVTLFGSHLYGEWMIDYIVAFLLGIIFQYYAIKPMKNLSGKEALIAALKADTLSLTFWQIGMYGWMAIANFLIFHQILEASHWPFWLMMQIAMLLGLLTAYPINWWLIKKGIKEKM